MKHRFLALLCSSLPVLTACGSVSPPASQRSDAQGSGSDSIVNPSNDANENPSTFLLQVSVGRFPRVPISGVDVMVSNSAGEFQSMQQTGEGGEVELEIVRGDVLTIFFEEAGTGTKKSSISIFGAEPGGHMVLGGSFDDFSVGTKFKARLVSDAIFTHNGYEWLASCDASASAALSVDSVELQIYPGCAKVPLSLLILASDVNVPKRPADYAVHSLASLPNNGEAVNVVPEWHKIETINSVLANTPAKAEIGGTLWRIRNEEQIGMSAFNSEQTGKNRTFTFANLTKLPGQPVLDYSYAFGPAESRSLWRTSAEDSLAETSIEFSALTLGQIQDGMSWEQGERRLTWRQSSDAPDIDLQVATVNSQQAQWIALSLPSFGSAQMPSLPSQKRDWELSTEGEIQLALVTGDVAGMTPAQVFEIGIDWLDRRWIIDLPNPAQVRIGLAAAN